MVLIDGHAVDADLEQLGDAGGREHGGAVGAR
jgi:hypothetical protein